MSIFGGVIAVKGIYLHLRECVGIDVCALDASAEQARRTAVSVAVASDAKELSRIVFGKLEICADIRRRNERSVQIEVQISSVVGLNKMYEAVQPYLSA